MPHSTVYGTKWNGSKARWAIRTYTDDDELVDVDPVDESAKPVPEPEALTQVEQMMNAAHRSRRGR